MRVIPSVPAIAVVMAIRSPVRRYILVISVSHIALSHDV